MVFHKINSAKYARSEDDHYCRTSNFTEKMASKEVSFFGQQRIPPSWITFNQEFEKIKREETVFVNLTSRFTIRKCCEGYKEITPLFGFPKCVSVCVNGKWNPTAKLCDCNRNYGGKFCDKNCKLGECVDQPLDYSEVEKVDKIAIRRHLQPKKMKLGEAPNKTTSLPRRQEFALTFDHKLAYQNRTLIGILFAVTSITIYLVGVAIIFKSAENANSEL
ncbi:unnamed protein product [Hermetia illucens]|uniref:EGF-like domain-containing protein n=1 Tax=Hermetia illucens TaxID=343691 RepID=A0A7R8UNF9_HERIL|nr:unnamed protein product [Hermetia illucens]